MSCGKQTYPTYYAAQKVLSRAKKNYGRYGKQRRRQAKVRPERVYHCPECGKYHLTSQKG